MGCCASAGSSGFAGDAEVLRATKLYFGLGELPLSVRATSKGTRLEVCTVGLEQEGLLGALERAFQRRCFWIVDATASSREGLFVGTFELSALGEADAKALDSVSTDEVLSKPCAIKFMPIDLNAHKKASAHPTAKRDLSPIKNFVQSILTQSDRSKTDASGIEVPTPRAGRTPEHTPSRRFDRQLSPSRHFNPQGATPEHTPSRFYVPASIVGASVGNQSPRQSVTQSPAKGFVGQTDKDKAAAGDPQEVSKPRNSLRVSLASEEGHGRRGSADGSLKSPRVSLILDGACDARTSGARQLSAVDAGAAQDGAVVRMTVVHEWAPGLRAAMVQVIGAADLRPVLVRLSFRRTGQRARMVKDTFWLAPREGKGNGSFSELQRVFDSLPDAGSRVGFVAPGDGRLELDLAGELRREEYRPDPILPWVLRESAEHIPYLLTAAPDTGLQFDGLVKFCGAGMNTTWDTREHVLEFSTYYVAAKNIGSKRGPLGGLLEQAKPFGEFVTQYNVREHRLTIYKVFLNSIVPSGKRAGMKVAAEQLLTVPVSGDWDGAASIKGLQEVHLCDIVNWNTYVLLNKAGQEADSETERWLLSAELAAAGITFEQLRKGTPDKVFPRTALGKLVHGMLDSWRASGVANHRVKEVRVAYNTSKQELIFGERRSVMDVTIMLGTEPEEPSS